MSSTYASPAWSKPARIAPEVDRDSAIARSIFAMTDIGRAKLKAEGLSEYAIDEIAEAALDAPEVKRHAASVGYLRRDVRTIDLAHNPVPPTMPATVAVLPRPAPTIAAPTFAPAPQSAPKSYTQNAEGWRAEWTASADLQREFKSAERYANYQAGVKDGRIRVFAGQERPTSQPIPFFGTAKQ